MTRRAAAALLTVLVLAAAGPVAAALAQQDPFGDLPQGQQATPTPAPVQTDATDSEDVGRTTLYAIMGGLILVLLGVGLWIARDARRRVPERHAPRPASCARRDRTGTPARRRRSPARRPARRAPLASAIARWLIPRPHGRLAAARPRHQPSRRRPQHQPAHREHRLVAREAGDRALHALEGALAAVLGVADHLPAAHEDEDVAHLDRHVAAPLEAERARDLLRLRAALDEQHLVPREGREAAQVDAVLAALLGERHGLGDVLGEDGVDRELVVGAREVRDAPEDEDAGHQEGADGDERLGHLPSRVRGDDGRENGPPALESRSVPPHRPLPKDPDLPRLEEQVLARWRERDVFRESLRRREGGERWVFYEGPPTANGRPGSHHVLARVFKDVFPRYQTMRGRYVERKGGWDCHGLPVEIAVEQKLGFSSKDDIERYGIAEFNAQCRESVFEFLEDWNALTERIAFWVDLENPYRTLDPPFMESVWWALRTMWERDLLFEGHKVVPYCARCGTALSSHEVAQGYEDVEDPSVFLTFPVDRAGRRAARRRQGAGVDDDAVDAALERRARRRPGPDLRAHDRRLRAGRGARRGGAR